MLKLDHQYPKLSRGLRELSCCWNLLNFSLIGGPGVPIIFPLKNQHIRGQKTVLLEDQDSIRRGKVRVLRVCLALCILFYLHILPLSRVTGPGINTFTLLELFWILSNDCFTLDITK